MLIFNISLVKIFSMFISTTTVTFILSCSDFLFTLSHPGLELILKHIFKVFEFPIAELK